MKNIFRMRRFLIAMEKLDADKEPVTVFTDLVLDVPKGNFRSKCITAYSEKYGKGYYLTAENICDSALAREYIIATHHTGEDEERLTISPLKGSDLLSRTGFLNEIIKSVENILPLVAILISVVALLVSIVAIVLNI